jgi:uncharacterized phage protein gp47/JayE
MPGLSTAGFSIPTLDELYTQLKDLARARIDPELDTGPDSVIGILLGIFAERLHDVWLGERDVYSAFLPGGATGVALTNLSLLTGTLRRPATFGRVSALANLNSGVTLPAGSQARVPGQTVTWVTQANVTNAGPSATNVAVILVADATGPQRANAGTLTEIASPVSGWNSITNPTDAVLGLSDETDGELRVRREAELRVQGSGNIDAIVADVGALEGVIDTKGTENTSDIVDGEGIPAHAFRVVVWDGVVPGASDDEIAQAIWEAKPAGILSYGTTGSGNALDALGTPHAVLFDRATLVPVYLTVDLDINLALFPADGVAQIKNAMVDYANSHWGVGDDVIRSALYGAIFSVSGVERINQIYAGTAPSPFGTVDLTIGPAEIAILETTNIVLA